MWLCEWHLNLSSTIDCVVFSELKECLKGGKFSCFGCNNCFRLKCDMFLVHII